MAEALQLDRPGVEVIQEFVATAPTILRPSLQACIVGPCKQVMEAVLDDGTLNSDALITTPARFTTPYLTTPFQYVGVGGSTLLVSVHNGPLQPIAFSGSNLTPEQIVDQVLTAAISGLTARVETSGVQKRVVLETVAKGDNASLTVGAQSGAPLLVALGLAPGQQARGISGYNNTQTLRIQASDYPDPRGNQKDLKIDYSSVRVFLNPGTGSPREVTRSTGFLRGAQSAVTVFDDGDGDALSPYYDFAGADFAGTATRARVEGTAALTGADFTAMRGKVLRMGINGEPFQTLVVPDSVTDAAGLTSALNALFGAGTAAVANDHLVLTPGSGFGGQQSSIHIDRDASNAQLLTALGLTGNGAPFEGADIARGTAHAPRVGDEVWANGLRLGTIVEVPPTPNNRLRLDTERLVTYSAASWYIIARDLDNNAATSDRPASDLVIDDETGTIEIRAGLFTDTAGVPTKSQGLLTYLAYDALRLDVTPAKKASDFNLLRIGSLTDLEDKLAPIDTQNPLALGMYYALLNAPGLEVTGCGVDEVNANAPEGTTDSYARTFEYLESKDIYTIVPLTHSPEVGEIAAVHTKAMSEPQNGLERVVFINPMRPTRRANVLVASGPRANVSAPPTDTVQTGIANLQALLAAAGKPGPTYTEDDGVFLALGSDNRRYLVESVSSGQITLNNGPFTKNTDGFYFDNEGDPVFDELIVDRPFSIAVRGAVVTNRTEEAAAYGDLGRGYKSPRVRLLAPDTVKTTLDGLESAVPGYYAACAVAGRISAKNPSQPLTEDPIAGFTGVVGTQERYSEPQLRMMAGGGVWILYQDADGQPVRTRHQLTTDVSTLLTREASITDAVDYAAKTLRSTFRNFVGRYNITTGLIEALNLVCDGVKDFFIQNSIFSRFEVVQIQQDVNNPDEINIVVDIITLKPLNKIRLTLRVT
jgi:hypothetical protein